MRRLVALLLAFVVLAVVALVAVGELALRPRAEAEAARRVAARYRLSSEPEVRLYGFPFVLRAAQGRLPEATVRLDGAVIEGLAVRRAEVDLHDVRFSPSDLLRGGDGGVRAGRASARVTVADEALSAYLAARGAAVQVRFVNGAVEAAARVVVLGVLATVVASGPLTLAGGQLSFAPEQVSAAGVTASLGELRRAVAFSVPLPEVAGVRLTGLAVGDGEAQLAADVTGYVLLESTG